MRIVSPPPYGFVKQNQTPKHLVQEKQKNPLDHNGKTGGKFYKKVYFFSLTAIKSTELPYGFIFFIVSFLTMPKGIQKKLWRDFLSGMNAFALLFRVFLSKVEVTGFFKTIKPFSSPKYSPVVIFKGNFIITCP